MDFIVALRYKQLQTYLYFHYVYFIITTLTVNVVVDNLLRTMVDY